VTFEEAAEGTTKTIRLRRSEPCSDCGGTGARDGTAFETCPGCRGTGAVTRSTGFFTMQTACGRCGGAGRIIREVCRACGGEGRTSGKAEVEVDVPAGIEDGTRIRIAGEGEQETPGGPRGDLYCHVRVEPHQFFVRDGDNLVFELPITYSQAALGAEVEVPTLAGTAKLKIPRGTQTGDVFRLRGQGLPNVHTGRKGDLFARAAIEVPKKLTKRHEEILRELAETEEASVSPKRRSFLEWLKSQFAADEKK
jgi:molecular chaperone DnaJ